MFSLQDLAGDILTVMRLRLKRFLNFLETSPRASRGLLASLDADTCQWVRSARDTEAVAKGGVKGGVQTEKEAGEPLRSTHGVLLCLARALPRESRYKVGHGVVWYTCTRVRRTVEVMWDCCWRVVLGVVLTETMGLGVGFVQFLRYIYEHITYAWGLCCVFGQNYFFWCDVRTGLCCRPVLLGV